MKEEMCFYLVYLYVLSFYNRVYEWTSKKFVERINEYNKKGTLES